MMKLVLLAAVVAVAIAHEGCDHGEVITRAIAHLDGNGVVGNVIFTRQKDGKIRVTGKVTGMPPGKYGLHVHEKGDMSEGCTSLKEHFNPDGHAHGHPDDEHRHAGDIGNITFDKDGVANIDIVDKEIKLMGAHNIIGRGLVLTDMEDDHGKGGHPLSTVNGNSGGRVVCGVIGIM